MTRRVLALCGVVWFSPVSTQKNIKSITWCEMVQTRQGDTHVSFDFRLKIKMKLKIWLYQRYLSYRQDSLFFKYKPASYFTIGPVPINKVAFESEKSCKPHEHGVSPVRELSSAKKWQLTDTFFSWKNKDLWKPSAFAVMAKKTLQILDQRRQYYRLSIGTHISSSLYKLVFSGAINSAHRANTSLILSGTCTLSLSPTALTYK